MKKKNVIFSVAAATTILAASPLAGNAEAASIQPNEAKVIYQTHALSEEQLNKIVNNISAKYQIDINKVWNEIQTSYANKQAVQDKTIQKETQKNAPQEKKISTQKQASSTTPMNNNTPAAPAKETASKASTSVSAYEKAVVELTNKERAKHGLKALTLDSELSKVAKLKSQDMRANNYFDHTSPTYGSPFDMMKQFGISYKAAGENIAKGQKTPEEVVKAWMNSEGHRANILSNKFTHIGVGYVEDGNYWTQQFIGK